MYHTPPTYSWYLAGLVFQWLKKQGGLNAMAELNQRKAKKLYDYIDNSGFYSNPIEPRFRSRMNVPFILAASQQEEAVMVCAEGERLRNLKRQNAAGGMRATTS